MYKSVMLIKFPKSNSCPELCFCIQSETLSDNQLRRAFNRAVRQKMDKIDVHTLPFNIKNGLVGGCAVGAYAKPQLDHADELLNTAQMVDFRAIHLEFSQTDYIAKELNKKKHYTFNEHTFTCHVKTAPCGHEQKLYNGFSGCYRFNQPEFKDWNDNTPCDKCGNPFIQAVIAAAKREY